MNDATIKNQSGISGLQVESIASRFPENRPE
jgi:hypothetical protein